MGGVIGRNRWCERWRDLRTILSRYRLTVDRVQAMDLLRWCVHFTDAGESCGSAEEREKEEERNREK